MPRFSFQTLSGETVPFEVGRFELDVVEDIKTGNISDYLVLDTYADITYQVESAYYTALKAKGCKEVE